MSDYFSILQDQIWTKLEAGYVEQYRELTKYTLTIDSCQKIEALVGLLIAKGVFTKEEWEAALGVAEENGKFAEAGKSICENLEKLNNMKELIDSKDYDKLMEMYQSELEDGDAFANLFKDGKNPFAFE